MQFAPSIQQCSIGCNISPGERYGELRRTKTVTTVPLTTTSFRDRGRFWLWLCEPGKDRPPRQPVQRRGDDFMLPQRRAGDGRARRDILRRRSA